MRLALGPPLEEKHEGGDKKARAEREREIDILLRHSAYGRGYVSSIS